MFRQRIKTLKLLSLGFELVLRRPIETTRKIGKVGFTEPVCAPIKIDPDNPKIKL
jgi:hypothetical protein